MKKRIGLVIGFILVAVSTGWAQMPASRPGIITPPGIFSYTDFDKTFGPTSSLSEIEKEGWFKKSTNDYKKQVVIWDMEALGPVGVNRIGFFKYGQVSGGEADVAVQFCQNQGPRVSYIRTGSKVTFWGTIAMSFEKPYLIYKGGIVAVDGWVIGKDNQRLHPYIIPKQ